MDSETVIARLRAHERELREAGILRLSVFGSVARGEAGPNSDVDLIAQFDKTRRLTLFDVAGLESRLSEILGVGVELAPEDMLLEPVRVRAEREAVLAF
ncbi:MAG: nucleotidyltransferase domain-containing protein [Bryobacteraceae bacterium]